MHRKSALNEVLDTRRVVEVDEASRSERRDEVKMHRLLDLEKREYYARYCRYHDYAWMHVGALVFPFPFPDHC